MPNAYLVCDAPAFSLIFKYISPNQYPPITHLKTLQISKGGSGNELGNLFEIAIFKQPADTARADRFAGLLRARNFDELDAVLRQNASHRVIVLPRHIIERFLARETYRNAESRGDVPGEQFHHKYIQMLPFAVTLSPLQTSFPIVQKSF
jgi:hypothetical protein